MDIPSTSKNVMVMDLRPFDSRDLLEHYAVAFTVPTRQNGDHRESYLKPKLFAKGKI